MGIPLIHHTGARRPEVPEGVRGRRATCCPDCLGGYWPGREGWGGGVCLGLALEEMERQGGCLNQQHLVLGSASLCGHAFPIPHPPLTGL